MEYISTQSSDMTEKTSGMNKSQITALVLNLLSTDSMIRSTGIHIPEMKPCILCKQKFTIHPDEPIKEFTMTTCGCLYHQKCLEGFLLNVAKTRAKLSCPNWDCKGREIETLITQDLFKEMDKPTTLTAEDTASNQVYSENATPVSEDANEIYMNQLELFSGEEQSSSKTTEITKETFDQATSPIEVVSTTPGNPENLDDLISKDTSGQIQRPICEKCSEEISLEFTKPTIFLPCKHVVHYDCIKNSHKMCPTCPLSEMISEVSTLVELDLSDI